MIDNGKNMQAPFMMMPPRLGRSFMKQPFNKTIDLGVCHS